MGDGLVRNTAKMRASAVSACSPPGKERKARRLLARRARDQVQAGFQRIIGFDQLQFGGSAAKERRKEMLEVSVDGLKCLQQAAATFLVQLLDTAAQLGNGLDQIVALSFQTGVLLLKGLQLGVGAQVHPA